MKTRLVGIEIKEVEIYQDICDACNKDLDWDEKREETAKVQFSLGYFSFHDGCNAMYSLCNYCAEDLYKLMRDRFPLLDPMEDQYGDKYEEK